MIQCVKTESETFIESLVSRSYEKMILYVEFEFMQKHYIKWKYSNTARKIHVENPCFL